MNAIGVNIAADIPEDQANNFKEMCQLFASINKHEHDQAVDEYLLKLSPLAKTATASAATNVSSDMTPVNNANDIAGCSAQVFPIIRELLSSNQNDRSIEQETTVSQSVPSVPQARQNFELEIFKILVQFIHNLDPTMKLFPFGSTQYGVASPNATNFNLLITTGEYFCHFIVEKKGENFILIFFFQAKIVRNK